MPVFSIDQFEDESDRSIDSFEDASDRKRMIMASYLQRYANRRE